MPLTSSKDDLQKWADRLRNPGRLRMAITGLLLCLGYAGIYLPGAAHLETVRQRIQIEETRQELFNDVTFLEAQLAMYAERISTDDPNQWVQYVIDGIRQFPVKLVNLDSGDMKRLSPYRVVTMRVNTVGKMEDLDAMLHWLETDKRLFRIDSVKIEPSKESPELRSMQISLLGLKG
jgi:hypothetical protein